jgi:hypothetical protein
MPQISKGLRQAYELQDFTYDALASIKDQLTVDGKLVVSPANGKAIAELTKAWVNCQERIAFHRRVPSPGSLRPVKQEKVKLGKWMIGPVAAIDAKQISDPAVQEPEKPSDKP